ncbi:hypothetical protein SAMN02745216_04118 [Desulfatibacillum alkenivorans DSM 16219]|uniref:Uncharacterized protein n=1 Tax=Desulfatibacillum alkenivorans DSM 16219 TaxID=1121393 RepID=A0A1M6VIA6_9BACT|nr:hypothetical protein [Desulfatibacillum alkenivorans]SHK81085.1 hypothetical protein SAMN02745216_04118 [Desulfatibacillum alkenivorans DSM 16219]
MRKLSESIANKPMVGLHKALQLCARLTQQETPDPLPAMTSAWEVRGRKGCGGGQR